jgi:copper chaperone CopZ
VRRIAGLLAVAAVALSCIVSGCGAPDRKAAADRLKQAIKEMPGVQDATVNYTNGFEQGATVNIYVYLPEAPSKQIEDVVARINAVRGDAFKAFDQTADFAVTTSRTVLVKRGADLDPAGIAADAEALRRLTAAVDAAEVSIFRNKSTADLKLDEVTTPADDVFAAVRAGFGDNAHVTLDLQPASNIDQHPWRVAFPFTAPEQQRVDQQIAAMPVSVFTVTVGPQGTITDLNVGLDNRDTAYQDLVSVIGITGAGPAHALNLSWRWAGAHADTSPNFSGTVDVGACNYIPNSLTEQHPETYLTPAALALQQRLRKQFDTCPK